jgi:hypothetical protein
MSVIEMVALGIMGPIDAVGLLIAWRHRASIDRVISTAVNRWLVARHRPENIGMPDEPEPWCLTCRKSWPCDDWVKLMDERETIA